MPEETHAGDRQQRWDMLQSWCAERGAGTWPVLRDACAHLDLNVQQAVRRLSALGHLEMSWTRGRWAAPPAMLVELEEPFGRLLLTGAVTADLPAQLDAALCGSGADAAVLGPFAHDGRGPSTVHVECGSEQWAVMQRATGLRVMPAFARRLAQLLPPADSDVVGTAYVPDQRLHTVPVHASTGEEGPDDEDAIASAVGVAMAEIHPSGRRTWWVRSVSGQARRLASAEWAPYLARREGLDPLMRHVSADRVLCVIADAPLPPLHARVACLCSGRVPRRVPVAAGIAEDRYAAVPAIVAEPIMRSLGQGGIQAG